MSEKFWSWREFIGAVLGTFLFSLAVNVFIVPQALYNGGLLGISQLLRTLITYLLPFEIHFDMAGIISYILNVPMLILAWRALNRRVFFKTIICVTLQTICLTFIPIPTTPIISDCLTSCVIGGLLAGYGCGLVLRYHFTGGGTDVLGLVLTRKYARFSVGKLSIAINVVVYIICAFTQNLETAIYSIIYTVVTDLVVDWVHSENVCSQATIFCIREEDRQEILDYIVNTLDRTATALEGSGGYTGGKIYVIYAVLSEYELGVLERYLRRCHTDVFLVKTNRVGIFGRFEKKLI